MKAGIIIALLCAAGFQVAGMVGKGTGAQQTAVSAVSQAYQEEAR